MAMTLMLIGVMGCSVKENTVEQTGNYRLVFEADPFINGDADTATKTYVEPNSDYSSYAFKWAERDTVGIYPDAGSQVYFTMAGGAGASTAEFDGGAWTCKEGHEYRSYFPFVGDYYLDATSIPVSFTGQKQVGNANSDHFQQYDYMYTPVVTKGNDNLTFSYHHLITAILPWVELPAGHYTGITLSLDEPLFVTEGHYDLTAASPAIVGTAFSSTLNVELDVTFTTHDILKVFIPLAPLDMSGKTLTITVTDEDNHTYEFTKNPSKAYVAGKIYRLRADTSFANASIVFADPTVKAICVANWDTNNDGELSFSEAAAVTTIPYSAFAENTTITSFDEFQYFTGVTLMQYDSDYDEGMDYYGTFYRCTSLRSITLPSTLTKIPFGCFRGCSALEKIIIPASVNTIEQVAFLGCENLYVYMESETPCTLQKDVYNTYDEPYVFGFLSGGKVKRIYVPTEASVEVYQAAQYWSTYSLRIKYVGIQVTGIQLSGTASAMVVGGTKILMATVLPDNATYNTLSWSSSNPAIATVSSSGKVTAVAEGSATITASSTDGSGCTATFEVTVTPAMAVPEAVDLGLSVKWASFNVGASAPEEFGEYFAWGETEPKSDYSWSTYKFRVSGDSNNNLRFNKYCPSNQASYWGVSGSPDNKTDLDLEDDAAHFNWGGSWRIPTDEDWTELRDNCTWTWTSNYNESGIAGWVVSASNGNSIFLPAAGIRFGVNLDDSGSYGGYWSSSLDKGSAYNAWGVYFYSSYVSRRDLRRDYGRSVRPVIE
ncbi:MAG: leucine-rich repeat protein [Bacteroidales bacterium]|nr:leucine-rich repeat protein [Bacteroidales bacterium]